MGINWILTLIYSNLRLKEQTRSATKPRNASDSSTNPELISVLTQFPQRMEHNLDSFDLFENTEILISSMSGSLKQAIT